MFQYQVLRWIADHLTFRPYSSEPARHFRFHLTSLGSTDEIINHPISHAAYVQHSLLLGFLIIHSFDTWNVSHKVELTPRGGANELEVSVRRTVAEGPSGPSGSASWYMAEVGVVIVEGAFVWDEATVA